EFSQLPFELTVKILRAADEPNRGHSETSIVEGLVGGLNNVGMVGETQIVIGAKIKGLPILGVNNGPLRRGNDSLFFIQSGGSDLGNFRTIGVPELLAVHADLF